LLSEEFRVTTCNVGFQGSDWEDITAARHYLDQLLAHPLHALLLQEAPRTRIKALMKLVQEPEKIREYRHLVNFRVTPNPDDITFTRADNAHGLYLITTSSSVVTLTSKLPVWSSNCPLRPPSAGEGAAANQDLSAYRHEVLSHTMEFSDRTQISILNAHLVSGGGANSFGCKQGQAKTRTLTHFLTYAYLNGHRLVTGDFNIGMKVLDTMFNASAHNQNPPF